MLFYNLDIIIIIIISRLLASQLRDLKKKKKTHVAFSD